jgi:2-methylcitrate dehydratase PrpD
MSPDLELVLAQRAIDFAAAPPPHLLARAARHVADFIGVFIAGTASPEMIAFLSLLRTEAGMVGSNRRFNLDEPLPRRAKAAFLGAAGHFHDFDDDEPTLAIGHPTVVVAAAAFAALKSHHTGTEFLAAYLAGVETIGRLGACVNPGHYNRGWHATASLGIFGAAVASALLERADANQLAHALRFAAASSSGLKAAFGSSAKPIQVGDASASGLAAAAMATSGLESSPGLLFGELGWVSIFNPQAPVEEIVKRFADPHLLDSPGLNIKRYPCCSSSHTAIDGLLDIMQHEKLDQSDIERIEVGIGADVPGILIYDIPTSGLEAKFSLRYPLAVAALSRRLTLEDFENDRITKPEVREMMNRIRVRIDHDLPRSQSGVTHCSKLTVHTKSGYRLDRFTENPKGSVEQPLSEEELRQKFVKCSQAVLDDNAALGAFSKLLTMSDLPTALEALAPAQLSG